MFLQHVTNKNLKRNVLIVAVTALVLGTMLYSILFLNPYPNEPSGYSKTPAPIISSETSPVDLSNYAKLTESNPKSGVVSANFGLKYKFSKPVDLDKLDVQVDPQVDFKVVSYKDPTEIWILPTNGSYWSNGTEYFIKISNYNDYDPTLSEPINFVFNFSYPTFGDQLEPDPPELHSGGR